MPPEQGPEPAAAPSVRRRVLCDESVPYDVSARIVGHDVSRVQELGWAGTKNGALLRRARAAGFEVLVTVDRNLEYQQNIPASGLALVVVRAPSSRVPDLLPAVSGVITVLPDVAAGTVTQVRSAGA